MSVFNNNATGLKSTNKPSALLELGVFLAELERTASTAEVTLNNITLAFDGESRTATITATLPIAPIVTPEGNVLITASNYLGNGYVFSGNANSDLKSQHPPAAFVEMAQIVSASEKAIAQDPPNNITIAMDFEGGIAAITATLPFTFSTDANGRPVITAVDYLP